MFAVAQLSYGGGHGSSSRGGGGDSLGSPRAAGGAPAEGALLDGAPLGLGLPAANDRTFGLAVRQEDDAASVDSSVDELHSLAAGLPPL